MNTYNFSASFSGMPLVSVVIPLYNQERFLDACIRSVTGQTYKNLEIIIVNDGSSDRSLLMAKEWANKDSRIIIIDKKNEGVTWARRDGLLKAKGEFLCFVDSDDLLPKKSVELLIDAVKESNADLVFGAVVRKMWLLHQNQNPFFTFPSRSLISQPQLFDDYYVGFHKNNVFPVPMYARLYRKSIVDAAMQETELFSTQVSNMGEDQLFNLLLFPYLRSMYRIDDVVYFYRYGGMTTRYNPHLFQLLDYSDIRLSLLDQYEYEKGYKPLYVEYLNMLYGCATLLLQYKVADKTEVMEFFRREIENRAILQRAVAYFNNHEPLRRYQVELINNRDLEGMYKMAYDRMKTIVGSKTYKMKVLLNKLIMSIPSSILDRM